MSAHREVPMSLDSTWHDRPFSGVARGGHDQTGPRVYESCRCLAGSSKACCDRAGPATGRLGS